MDAKEIAHGLAVEHHDALAQLRVGEMRPVNRPRGLFDIRDAIAVELESWLAEFLPDADFEVTNAGVEAYQVKRVG